MQAPVPEAKIILLGEFGVGKTSIFRRFSQNTFIDTSGMDWSQYRESTLGLDNYSKQFECANEHQSDQSKSLRLRLFDTGGLERVGSISNSYYKFSEAVLLVFASNNLDSFNCITQHLLEVLSLAENAKLFLVANKLDLAGEREVSDEDVRTFMEQFPDIEAYYRISCKTNKPPVDDMFCDIAQRIVSSASNRLAHHFDTIKLSRSPPSQEYQYFNSGEFYNPHDSNRESSSCSTCSIL